MNQWHCARLQRPEIAVQGAPAYKIQCMFRSIQTRLFAVVMRAHRERVRAASTLQRAYRAMRKRRIDNFMQLAQLTVKRNRAGKAATRPWKMRRRLEWLCKLGDADGSSTFGSKEKAKLGGEVRKVTPAAPRRSYRCWEERSSSWRRSSVCRRVLTRKPF